MLRRLLLTLALTTSALAQQPVTINVDLSKPIGPYKQITSWFGYDESNYTTTPNGRALLHELHDAYPVPVYIRAHHLLTSGDGKPELKWSSTNVYTVDAHGKPVYDFKILDGIFDALRDAGVRPMVEFGFMPEALASGPAPYQTHYPKTLDGSSQSPPKDYKAWQELCRVVTAHMVKRYGRATAAQWYWEVWNEPNIPYWHGTQADYFKLYDYTVAGVRAALPQARVGGPATTSPRDDKARNYLEAFLEHIVNDKSASTGATIPLDFISFHIKGQPRLVKATAAEPEHVRMGLDKELTDADRGFALIASMPRFHNLPIILSEADPEGCAACSAKENPANAYRNGPLYPAYTAASIKALFDLQDRHHVNLLAMLSWSFEFEGRDYFEGFRTLATNGIDKPVLNVFRMAAKMSGDRVATTSSAAVSLDDLIATSVRSSADVDALATRHNNTAAILLWNYHDDDFAAPPASVRITLSGLPTGVRRLHIERFRIDDTHSNAFTAWKAMGSPQSPTPEQIAALKRAGALEKIASTDLSGPFTSVPLDELLPRQATELIQLTW